MPGACQKRFQCRKRCSSVWLVVLFLVFSPRRICVIPHDGYAFGTAWKNTDYIWLLIICWGFDFEVLSCLRTLCAKRLPDVSIAAWMLHKFSSYLPSGCNSCKTIGLHQEWSSFNWHARGKRQACLHADIRSCKHVRRLTDWQKDGWLFSTDGRVAAVI